MVRRRVLVSFCRHSFHLLCPKTSAARTKGVVHRKYTPRDKAIHIGRAGDCHPLGLALGLGITRI